MPFKISSITTLNEIFSYIDKQSVLVLNLDSLLLPSLNTTEPDLLCEASIQEILSHVSNIGTDIVLLVDASHKDREGLINNIRLLNLNYSNLLFYGCNSTPPLEKSLKKEQVLAEHLTSILKDSSSKNKRVVIVDANQNDLSETQESLSFLKDNIKIIQIQYNPQVKIFEDNTCQFPMNLDDFNVVKSLGGGTKSTYEVSNGSSSYVLKFGVSQNAIKMEMLENQLYQLLGVKVPKSTGYKSIPVNLANQLGLKHTGSFVQISEKIKATGLSADMLSKISSDKFVIHAFLGNIDLKAENYVGEFMVDAGASFLSRSLGECRDEDPHTVSELESLRDPSVNIQSHHWFKNLSDDDIHHQSRQLLSFHNAFQSKLNELLQHLYFDDELYEWIFNVFAARYNYLALRFAPKEFNPLKYMQPINNVTASGILTLSLGGDGKQLILLSRRSRHNWVANFGGKSEHDSCLAETACREVSEESSHLIRYSSEELLGAAYIDYLTPSENVKQYRLFIHFLKDEIDLNKIIDSEHSSHHWVSFEMIQRALESDTFKVTEEGRETVYLKDINGEMLILYPPLYQILKHRKSMSLIKDAFSKKEKNSSFKLISGEYTNPKSSFTIKSIPSWSSVQGLKLEVGNNLSSSIPTVQAIKDRGKHLVESNLPSIPERKESISKTHLKVIMGVEYNKSLPLEDNICTYLKSEKCDIRRQLSDNELILLSKNISMLIEREEEDINYIYHGCDGSISFAYTLYTCLYRKLYLDMHKFAFRVESDLFNEFKHINDFIDYFSRKGNIHNYDDGYMNCTLSANWTLFGNHNNSSSNSLYYLLHNRTCSQINLKLMLESLFEPLGINTVIINRLISLFQKSTFSGTGFLYQIGFDQETLDNNAYISLPGGRLSGLHINTKISDFLRLNPGEWEKYSQARLMIPPHISPKKVNSIAWSDQGITEHPVHQINKELNYLVDLMVNAYLNKRNSLAKNLTPLYLIYKEILEDRFGISQCSTIINTSKLQLLAYIKNDQYDDVVSLVKKIPKLADIKLSVKTKRTDYTGNQGHSLKTLLQILLEKDNSRKCILDIYGDFFYKIHYLDFNDILLSIKLIPDDQIDTFIEYIKIHVSNIGHFKKLLECDNTLFSDRLLHSAIHKKSTLHRYLYNWYDLFHLPVSCISQETRDEIIQVTKHDLKNVLSGNNKLYYVFFTLNLELLSENQRTTIIESLGKDLISVLPDLKSLLKFLEISNAKLTEIQKDKVIHYVKDYLPKICNNKYIFEYLFNTQYSNLNVQQTLIIFKATLSNIDKIVTSVPILSEILSKKYLTEFYQELILKKLEGKFPSIIKGDGDAHLILKINSKLFKRYYHDICFKYIMSNSSSIFTDIQSFKKLLTDNSNLSNNERNQVLDKMTSQSSSLIKKYRDLYDMFSLSNALTYSNRDTIFQKFINKRDDSYDDHEYRIKLLSLTFFQLNWNQRKFISANIDVKEYNNLNDLIHYLALRVELFNEELRTEVIKSFLKGFNINRLNPLFLENIVDLYQLTLNKFSESHREMVFEFIMQKIDFLFVNPESIYALLKLDECKISNDKKNILMSHKINQIANKCDEDTLISIFSLPITHISSQLTEVLLIEDKGNLRHRFTKSEHIIKMLTLCNERLNKKHRALIFKQMDDSIFSIFDCYALFNFSDKLISPQEQEILLSIIENRIKNISCTFDEIYMIFSTKVPFVSEEFIHQNLLSIGNNLSNIIRTNSDLIKLFSMKACSITESHRQIILAALGDFSYTIKNIGELVQIFSIAPTIFSKKSREIVLNNMTERLPLLINRPSDLKCLFELPYEKLNVQQRSLILINSKERLRDVINDMKDIKDIMELFQSDELPLINTEQCYVFSILQDILPKHLTRINDLDLICRVYDYKFSNEFVQPVLSTIEDCILPLIKHSSDLSYIFFILKEKAYQQVRESIFHSLKDKVPSIFDSIGKTMNFISIHKDTADPDQLKFLYQCMIDNSRTMIKSIFDIHSIFSNLDDPHILILIKNDLEHICDSFDLLGINNRDILQILPCIECIQNTFEKIDFEKITSNLKSKMLKHFTNSNPDNFHYEDLIRALGLPLSLLSHSERKIIIDSGIKNMMDSDRISILNYILIFPDALLNAENRESILIALTDITSLNINNGVHVLFLVKLSNIYISGNESESCKSMITQALRRLIDRYPEVIFEILKLPINDCSNQVKELCLRYIKRENIYADSKRFVSLFSQSEIVFTNAFRSIILNSLKGKYSNIFCTFNGIQSLLSLTPKQLPNESLAEIFHEIKVSFNDIFNDGHLIRNILRIPSTRLDDECKYIFLDTIKHNIPQYLGNPYDIKSILKMPEDDALNLKLKHYIISKIGTEFINKVKTFKEAYDFISLLSNSSLPEKFKEEILYSILEKISSFNINETELYKLLTLSLSDFPMKHRDIFLLNIHSSLVNIFKNTNDLIHILSIPLDNLTNSHRIFIFTVLQQNLPNIIKSYNELCSLFSRPLHELTNSIRQLVFRYIKMELQKYEPNVIDVTKLLKLSIANLSYEQRNTLISELLPNVPYLIQNVTDLYSLLCISNTQLTSTNKAYITNAFLRSQKLTLKEPLTLEALFESEKSKIAPSYRDIRLIELLRNIPGLNLISKSFHINMYDSNKSIDNNTGSEGIRTKGLC